jgi:rubrerythrin
MYARNDGITEKIFDDRKYYLEKMHEREKETERKAIEAAEAAKRAEEERIRRQELEKQMAEYRKAGVCQYCGGEFKKTLFGYKCVSCGRRKDY